ncbi:MAG TPA: phage portal protein, partial [Gammaproteobacteria bacterium]
MGHRWDRVRAAFGMPTRTFDAPQAVTFSVSPTLPVDQLIAYHYAKTGRIDRARALSVPAVRRGRNMICSVATLPLEAVDANNRVQDHRLLRQLDRNVANSVVLAQTIEDLLFEAVAWWRITDFGHDGYPVSVVRYDPGTVSMTPPSDYREGYLPSDLATRADSGRVWMGGEPVSIEQVIRFDSPNGAFLIEGERAIKRAIALDELADLYASNPQMRGFFSPKEGVDPDAGAVQQFLDDWAAGRTERVDGYVGAALDYKPVPVTNPTEMQLISQQQRADLAIANALGIDPEDLGINTTSRTYQNATDRRQDRINETLAPYMRAITDRLTMPDVTKRGLTVRFSLRDYLKADPKTRAEVQQIYAGIGATDAAEIREDEGRQPRRIEKAPAAATSLPASAPRRVESTVGDPVREIEAAGEPAHTFARETGLTFEGAVDETFAVDTEARTITGLAVPYGQSARSGGRRWRFMKGSIRYSAVNRVKLLRDHDSKQAIGKAVQLDDTDAGLVATFKVSPGPRGDEALALALDGVLDGL